MKVSTSYNSILLVLFVQISYLQLGRSQCQDNCNQHGICTTLSTCSCFAGYEGSDCSIKMCPTGPRYADVASSEDKAHAFAQCSGQGTCDTSTGLCTCFPGYTGYNCQKPSCPNNCGNHGVCISLREAARTYDGWTLNHTTTYTLWDADVSFGCQCDPGWSGHDCTIKSCDKGLDPRLSGSASETVTLVCTAGPSFGGKFKLRFVGKVGKSFLTGLSTATEVAAAIMESGGYFSSDGAHSYAPVKVLIDGSDSVSKTVCAASATTVTTIQFVRKSGDLAALSFYLNKITGASLYFQTTQILSCNCTSSMCDGTFQVSYEGEMSRRIDIKSTVGDLYDAINGMKTIQASQITLFNISYTPAVLTTDSSTLLCQDAVHHNHSIVFKAHSGNLPSLQLMASAVNRENLATYSTDNMTFVMRLYTLDGREEGVDVCNGLGGCDYATGTCKCNYGYEFDADTGLCGRPTINSSDWAGIGRCPGVISRIDGADWREKRNIEKIYLSFDPTWADDSRSGQTSYILKFDWDETTEIPDMLYWRPDAKYPRLDKTTRTPIFNMTTNTSAGPLVLDRADDYLYYVDNQETAPFIGRLKLNVNGTVTSEETFIVASGRIFGLAMDARMQHRKLYWSVPGTGFGTNGKIFWEYLDATSPSGNDLTATIGQSFLLEPMGIAIHYLKKRLYWVDVSLEYGYQITVLRSAELDGTDVQQVFLYRDVNNMTMPANATDITINLRNNSLYFIDNAEPKGIVETNLDFPDYIPLNDYNNRTGNRDYFNVTVLTRTDWINFSTPMYLFIDDTRDVLLWTDPDIFKVGWMDITNRSLETATSGTVYDFEEDFLLPIYHLGENFLMTETYERPVGIVLDKGMNEPGWGNYLDCFGNGRCSGKEGNWKCECFPGFFGDCSMRTCPTGPAWFSEPRVADISHDVEAECSNAGHCDRSTGECHCDTGYEGSACERATCPTSDTGTPCNGNGRCLSMKALAAKRMSVENEASAITYGSKHHKPDTWDATMRYGCYAEDYGYTESFHKVLTASGYGLSELECPYGYDTRRENPNVEIQQLSCRASGGYLRLSFRGQTTNKIYSNVTYSDLAGYLQSLSTIGVVTVTKDTGNTGDAICNSALANTVDISFDTELGNIPLLTVSENNLEGAATATVSVFQIANGTLLECSGRGDCDRSTGMCLCWDYRGSSDGFGNQGTRQDCGFNIVY